MHKTEILKFQDLTDLEAKGLVASVSGKQRNIFVVRRNEKVYAYLNWCPHNQVLIDQIPNKFFKVSAKV